MVQYMIQMMVVSCNVVMITDEPLGLHCWDDLALPIGFQNITLISHIGKTMQVLAPMAGSDTYTTYGDDM